MTSMDTDEIDGRDVRSECFLPAPIRAPYEIAGSGETCLKFMAGGRASYPTVFVGGEDAFGRIRDAADHVGRVSRERPAVSNRAASDRAIVEPLSCSAPRR